MCLCVCVRERETRVETERQTDDQTLLNYHAHCPPSSGSFSPSSLLSHLSRNRLKVYQGINNVLSRDYKAAAALFLETVSTFTSLELMSYPAFVGMTVLVAAIALDRPELKEKVGEKRREGGREHWRSA